MKINNKIVIKSVIYLISMLFLTSIVLGLMKDDDTSFWVKISQSSSFAIKFVVLEIAIFIGTLFSDWIVFKKNLIEKIHVDKIQEWKLSVILKKYIFPLLIYVLAIIVVALNVSLMFDNVVWGDEAFSANTAKNSVYGVMQILYYWDNHPPLHYLWIKLFGDIFGHSVPIYHLASLVPFVIGIILAVTVIRKKFGNIPAAFFVIISGLGASCLEYNLEIRMYSLAFLGVLGAFYCSYKVISTGKKSAWIGMVLWALEAAYSHYYALVAVGLLLFFTAVAVWVKQRGKSWIKGVMAILVFLLGYAPWLYFLFTAMKNISKSWWMTDILGLDRTMDMVMGDKGLSACIFPITVLVLLILVCVECEIVTIDNKDGKSCVIFHKPSIKNWSNEMYSIIVGVATIIGTVSFAYFISYVMQPMLAQRYMYPLSAITFFVMIMGLSRILVLVTKREKLFALKGVMLLFLALFFVIGIGNYKEYRSEVIDQSNKTEATLKLIGEPKEDEILVTNGVKHLGWTILPHYFPETEFINGTYWSSTKDKFWYFSPTFISEEEVALLEEWGYNVTSYGQMQISQYPFALYYIEK